MYKRILSLLMLAVLTVVFCACGNATINTDNANVQTDKMDVADALEVDENAPVSYNFTSDDMIKMSAFNAGGEFAVEGDTIYARGYKDGNGILMAISTDFSEKTVIADVCASNINLFNDRIYFIDISANGSTGPICSVNTDGSDLQEIVSTDAFTLQVFNNKLYYTDAGSNYDYRSCKIDGTNDNLVIEGAVYYPYVIDDRIVYQKDSDGETLHVYKISDGSDKSLTSVVSYNPVFDGEYVYYTTPTNGGYNIARVNLETMADEVFDNVVAKTYELFVAAEKLYYYSDSDGKTLTSADIFEGNLNPTGKTFANNLTCRYVDTRYNIFVKNTAEGITGIVINNLKTGSKYEYLD